MIANHAEMGLLKSCNDVSAEFKAHGVTIWFLPPVWRKLHHEADTTVAAKGRSQNEAINVDQWRNQACSLSCFWIMLMWRH